MRWLVTTSKEVDEKLLDGALGPARAEREQQAPVPLGDDECAWEVKGPPDLDQRLIGVAQIKEVYPSSEMTLY
jgi:hypothetical protein